MIQYKMGLTEGWRFHYGDEPEAWYAGFDDSAWETVFVPHDYAVGGAFSEEYSSGTGYLRGGTAWYRKRFSLPDLEPDCTVRVLFDGVYKNSRVWCDSYYLGKHPGGYTPFSYDISHCVRRGGEHVLCVRVSHEDISDSRWYTGSGILRPVTILVDPPVHPAIGGIFFSAEEIRLRTGGQTDGGKCRQEQPLTAESATLRLRVRLENTGDRPQTVRLAARFAGVRETLFPETELCVPEQGDAGVTVTGRIAEPRLWSPEHPQLYTLLLGIFAGGSELPAETATDAEWTAAADSVSSVRVGIRSLAFDPDHGFFLNGVPEKIKGVCVHEDAGCLGAAVPSGVWERRLELLKGCGCNAIRMSHNPHADALYDLCDSMGFLVMDEAFDEWENPKNKWWQGHNVYPPRHQGSYEYFPAWHERDLCAMVRRGRNHPSVILWSIGNEIDYPNDPYCHPKFTTMTGNNDANKPEAEKRYDPHKPDMERLRTIAAGLAAIVRREDDTREVTLAAAYPELSADIGFIDAVRVVGYNYKEQYYAGDHRRFPEKVFLGSENGHSEEAWHAVTDNEYICGQFLWTGIDYLGEARGWPVHGSPAGLLTTAGFPGDRYYERQRLWGTLPVCPDTGVSDAGGVSAIPAAVIIEAPEGIRVTRWQPARAGADAEAARQWAERTRGVGFTEQLLITLTDPDGHPVRDNDRMIRVETGGAGCLAGLDNGDLADNTPFSSDCRSTCGGNLAVYIRRTGDGEIRVRILPG